MDGGGRGPHHRSAVQDGEPLPYTKGNSMTYRIQGIPTSYSYKSTKKILDSALGLNGKESCVHIHSLATNPYDPRENVATVTFNESIPMLTGKRVEWKIPLIGDEDYENDSPIEVPEITIDSHFEGFTSLNAIKCDGDHKIE
ncbi:MAG: hypothetical protein M1813_007494 [Trichoglossum hirsutum]|nr:MAG: hypothetical protein M1813_007494 [Trichoglossum hirsutum]